jgi:hypothetical protein
MTQSPPKLLLCYVSGLDLRRVSAEATPFLSGALARRPWAEMTNLPSNELLPTMLTGVYPPRHGVWGVRLRADPGEGDRRRLVDLLPDVVTTTAQCVVHALTGGCDLAAVPPRRRRRFHITRTKYVRRRRPRRVLPRIGPVESLIGVVGNDRSRYLFSSATDPRRLLGRVGSGRYVLDVLELYSLDRFQQWNLDRPGAVRGYYGRVDEFLERLEARCRAAGVTLAVLSDHGHEAVREAVDLRAGLADLRLPETEYSFFLELSIARFWFHSPRARERIDGMLSATPRVRMLGADELRELHLEFTDGRYGDRIAVAEPGTIFFPHDFHQPLANWALGLTDRKQWRRILDPRQRANHGYLPQHPCERGFLLLLDEGFTATRARMELIDVAPSALAVLDIEPPGTMDGRAAFARR